MATKQIRNLINSIDKTMFSTKSKLKEEKDKKIIKIKEKIPTKEEIKQKMITEACSPLAQKKVDNIYRKLHSTLSKLEKIGGNGKESMTRLLEKLNKIKDILLPKIQKILEFLKTYIIPILTIAIILAEIILNLPARYTTGGIIKKLSDKIEKAKSKIKEYKNLVKTILKYVPKYIIKALAIIAAIGVIILALTGMLAFIKKMKAFLEYLYLKYVKKCTIPDQTPIDAEGNINENLLEDNILDADLSGIVDTMTNLYNDLLEDLKEQGETKIIERLVSTKFDFRTSYEVKTISIL
tara:strand:+ start:3317 stop:4201 length:885 start_codon:yes stop_codon:yes gene_type:complete